MDNYKLKLIQHNIIELLSTNDITQKAELLNLQIGEGQTLQDVIHCCKILRKKDFLTEYSDNQFRITSKGNEAFKFKSNSLMFEYENEKLAFDHIMASIRAAQSVEKTNTSMIRLTWMIAISTLIAAIYYSIQIYRGK